MNNWKNDKRNLTKKTQAIVDGLGKSFFKEETIQWLGKRPSKERIDLIERIFEKGQEASKSEKYVLIAGLYEILTNHRILPIDPFKQEMVRIPFDVLLTQIEPVLEEKYAYFDELIKQTLTENPVGTEQKTKPVKESEKLPKRGRDKDGRGILDKEVEDYLKEMKYEPGIAGQKIANYINIKDVSKYNAVKRQGVEGTETYQKYLRQQQEQGKKCKKNKRKKK